MFRLPLLSTTTTKGRVAALACCLLLACGKAEPAGSAGRQAPPSKAVTAAAFPVGGLVARALGAVDGFTHTNSEAAFRRNYAIGRRWFEVDLTATADDALFAFHPKREKQLGLDAPFHEQTAAKVAPLKYLERYPLLRLEDMLQLIAEKKDAVLIVDPRRWTAKIAAALTEAVSAHPGLAARIVPQLYRQKDLELLNQASKGGKAPYPTFAFTLTRDNLANEKSAAFVAKHRIPLVLVPASNFSPWAVEELSKAGAKVIVQTVNRHEDVVELGLAGADGFYTDEYVPYSELFDAPPQSPLRARVLSSDRWSKFALSRGRDFRRAACLEKHAQGWLAQGCDTGSVVSGPRRPAPRGATVSARVVLSAVAPNNWARLQLSSKRGKNVHHRSDWVALPPGQDVVLEGASELSASVSDAHLAVQLSASDAGKAPPEQGEKPAGAVIIKEASFEISSPAPTTGAGEPQPAGNVKG